jgi:single-strand DNA-binding protein
MLPEINGEFGVVADPEIRFSGNGKAWLSMRVVAKDRTRDSNGEWTDGEPLFLNAVVFGKHAENLVESIVKGDSVVLKGRLRPNKWTDKEGNERNDVQIAVDYIGVDLRWNPAKTPRLLGESTSGGSSKAEAPEQSGDEPPF